MNIDGWIYYCKYRWMGCVRPRQLSGPPWAWYGGFRGIIRVCSVRGRSMESSTPCFLSHPSFYIQTYNPKTLKTGLTSLLSVAPPEEDSALKATVALGTLLRYKFISFLGSLYRVFNLCPPHRFIVFSMLVLSIRAGSCHSDRFIPHPFHHPQQARHRRGRQGRPRLRAGGGAQGGYCR